MPDTQTKDNPIETVLNKTEFVEYLKSLGAPEEDIEKQWKDLEFAFSAILLEEVMTMLEDDTKNQISEGITIGPNMDGMGELAKRIEDYAKQNPTAINYAKASENAAKQAQAKYMKFLEGAN